MKENFGMPQQSTSERVSDLALGSWPDSRSLLEAVQDVKSDPYARVVIEHEGKGLVVECGDEYLSFGRTTPDGPFRLLGKYSDPTSASMQYRH